MKNFKINMNREPLSDADINAGKDFGNLMQAYKAAKPPFFKAPKFWFGASAVVVATVAAVLVYTKVLHPGSIPAMPDEIAFVNPPMPEADIKRDVYVLNSERDTILTHSTGSKLRIPARAFKDAKGNVIKGKVELHYREFHDVVDVILAGIPMTYDSAGQRYHFETAGMMEINATQNGKALFTNADAPIQVDIASRDSRDMFNSYYLDTAKREWQYMAKANYTSRKVEGDVPVMNYEDERPIENCEGINMAEGLKEIRNEIVKMEQQKPIEPKTIDKNKPRFSIKVDEKEFPEIALYKGMKFQVVDISKYDEKKAKVMWDDISMKRVPNSLNYEITFSNTTANYVIEATPVFDTKEYAEAKKIYNEKFEAYETALATKKAEEAKLKADMEKRANEVRAAMQREIEAQQERQREYEKNLSQVSLVYRTFTINNFGTYNCDNPQALPQGGCTDASFKDKQTGKDINCTMVYLVEKGRNVIYTYYEGSYTTLRFNPSKQNLLWGITEYGKVAIVKPDEFAGAANGKKKSEFSMEVIDKKFSSAAEVKDYLQI